MAEFPILPLKTDALLADTSHMSAQEFGAYCRLLIAMWREGGSLLENRVELCRIAGVSANTWWRIKERVMRPMTVVAGVVTQKRLSATWAEVQGLREKKVRAANKRWISKRNADADADALQMHMKKTYTCNANQIRKKDRPSLTAARAETSAVDNCGQGTTTAAAAKRPPRKEGKQARQSELPPGTIVGPEVLR